MSILLTPPTSGLWTFLGTGLVTVAAVRTPTVTWEDVYQQLLIEYFITGYSNSSVGRVMLGDATGPNETGALHQQAILETTTNTNMVNLSGWPTAGAVSNRSRSGWMLIQNHASNAKTMSGFGRHDTIPPTAGTASVRVVFGGAWINTSSRAFSAKMANYDASTSGNVVSTRTFDVGTYIKVMGKNDD